MKRFTPTPERHDREPVDEWSPSAKRTDKSHGRKPMVWGFTIIALCGVFALSLFLHVGGIGQPDEAVFDEIHFGKFVQGYMKGEYYFDIHPPLGKLIFYGAARTVGLSPDYDFANIGEPYPNRQYVWLRLVAALFGSLLAPLVFLLVLRLSGSPWGALAAGLLVALDNALLVQSKFILMDAFLLFFGFLGVYLFLECRTFFQEGRFGSWSAYVAGAVLGCAMSVKWTAIGLLGLVLLFGFFKVAPVIWRSRTRSIELLLPYAGLVGIPILVYLFFFYIHFALLTNSGMGDAFMKPRFLASRAAGYPLSDFPSNFYDLNREMYAANKRLTQTHSYSSSWYSWPLMVRPIYYWNKDITDRTPVMYERIYLLGNPAVWWASTYAVIAMLFAYGDSLIFWFKRKKNRKKPGNEQAEENPEENRYLFAQTFLLAGYAANMLPFMFIGRVMFLYHYFIALVLAIMILGLHIGRMKRMQRPAVYGIGVLAAILFVLIMPVTYGSMLSDPWPGRIFWFSTWI